MLAATYGPGLVGALLVGVRRPRPLPAEHMVRVTILKGIFSQLYSLSDLEPPYVPDYVRGHSHIVHVVLIRSSGSWEEPVMMQGGLSPPGCLGDIRERHRKGSKGW